MSFTLLSDAGNLWHSADALVTIDLEDGESERGFRLFLRISSSIVLGIREAFLSLHCAGARTCNTFLLLP